MDRVPGAGDRARAYGVETGRAAPGSAAPGSMASGGAGEQAGRDRRVGWAALLVVWVLWGSTYFAIRVGGRDDPAAADGGHPVRDRRPADVPVRSAVPGARRDSGIACRARGMAARAR